MKHKKAILILAGILFFLSALTSYLNRVIFPQMIKQIVIERLEETLHRQVEIESIHFNWVKGFIIDKIKIHAKNSSTDIMAQANQVTFGLLFFPGVKHSRITIPFIHVKSPSIHLMRTAPGTWNFSDMLTPATKPAATAIPGETNKTPNIEVAWGGITITDGQMQLDDHSKTVPWSEYFDDINLKLSLSYKGISYDFTTNIPNKNGSIGATVYYQPITRDTRAKIHLKNIDTAPYLALIDIPKFDLKSGIIDEINLNIQQTQQDTSAQGDVLIKNLDITNDQQNFKGDIAVHDLDAQYHDGDIHAHGKLILSHIQSSMPGLLVSGSMEAQVDNFALTRDGVNFIGSLQAEDGSIDLKDRNVQVHKAVIENIRIKQDKNGVQSVGSITAQGLLVKWPNQIFRGDLTLKNSTLRMPDENNIHLSGDFQADSLFTNLGDKSIRGQQLKFTDAQLDIIDQQNIFLNTQVSLDQTRLVLGKNFTLYTSAQSKKLFFKLDNGMVDLATTLNTSSSKLILDHGKSIEGSPQLELHVHTPLNDPSQMIYKGSITLSDGTIDGFAPISHLDHVELDADFQNDQVTINALNTNILGTQVHINGTLQNFRNPSLDILAEADELNLAKLGELAPQLIDQLGLKLQGTTFVKVKFKGKSRDPLSGNILAVATFKNASVSSSKFRQEIKDVTGIIEMTPNSLKWRDTTFVWMGKKYSVDGHLNNFKHPKITADLTGPNLQLKAELTKNNNLITVDALSGKFYDASFYSYGTIALTPGEEPFVDLKANSSLLLENLVEFLPSVQKQILLPLSPTGAIDMRTQIKGHISDWKDYTVNTTITSPVITLMGYSLRGIKIGVIQDAGKIKQFLFNGNLYDGIVHAVGSMDLNALGMPYELALNIDGTDLHKLKMDSPLKMDEINGKFYFTTLAHGTVVDFKNSLQATGSMAVRDGFLGEFNLFKGLLGILNDAMQLGQVMITDVEANFTVANQRISTNNLRLKGPTIVLLGKGWVDFDQMCDLTVTVDLSSGSVPAIAHDVLNTLNIHIYDKISDPKFKRKISVPEVINTLFKKLWQ